MFIDTLHARRSGVHGEIGAWRRRPSGLWLPTGFNHNQIQIDWGFIACQTIGKGLRAYRISAMYIEFENLSDPDDEVTVPSFDELEGLEYYDDLQSSPTRDFLRVALVQEPLLGIISGDEAHFDAGTTGNKLTFFAFTSGTTGIHGKTFSDSVNSKVCGAALVAAPVFADRTQDVLFSRGYLETDEQVLKDPSEQIGMTWSIGFGI